MTTKIKDIVDDAMVENDTIAKDIEDTKETQAPVPTTKTLSQVLSPAGKKTGDAAHNYLRIGITLKDGDADVVRDALSQCNIGNIAEYARKLIFDDLQKRLTK